MPREGFHPNSYLLGLRNVKLGLRARSMILNVLEKNSAETKMIAKETGLPYFVVVHHLKLLETRGIVQRKSRKPSVWAVTGLGQKRLQ